MGGLSDGDVTLINMIHITQHLSQWSIAVMRPLECQTRQSVPVIKLSSFTPAIVRSAATYKDNGFPTLLVGYQWFRLPRPVRLAEPELSSLLSKV
eukprot:g18009.t1